VNQHVLVAVRERNVTGRVVGGRARDMVPSENEEPPMSTPLDTELGQKGSARKGQEVLEPVYPNSCMCRECCLRLIAYRGEHAEGVDGGDWGGDPDGVREVAVFGMACERQTLPAQKDRFRFPARCSLTLDPTSLRAHDSEHGRSELTLQQWAWS
jgi:hypothetical protein